MLHRYTVCNINTGIDTEYKVKKWYLQIITLINYLKYYLQYKTQFQYLQMKYQVRGDVKDSAWGSGEELLLARADG